MMRLIFSFISVVGISFCLLFPEKVVAQATQDCSQYANNPPYYQRCKVIQERIQRMQQSKEKRIKRSTDRRERVLKSFQRRPTQDTQNENKKKTEDAGTNSEKTESTQNAEKGTKQEQTDPSTQTSGTSTTTSTQDVQSKFFNNIPPKHRIIIDSRKLTREQLATIYQILMQSKSQPSSTDTNTNTNTTTPTATTTATPAVAAPVTKTIQRPSRPMTPISPSGSKRMIKLPDVGMGNPGYAPIEPLDPNDLGKP